MKIYTKTGDEGQTSLYGGQRVAKDHVRIEACGVVDELNAELGVVRAEIAAMKQFPEDIDALVVRVQNELFDIGAEIATPQPAEKGTALIGSTHIGALEQAIDHWQEALPPLKAFILPGGSAASAQLHVARAICRRGERLLVTVARESELRREPIVYLNRLSDLLFVLARAVNQIAGHADIPWRKTTP
ncbi:MAG: cob(I)yrinic acid a,c-diamide adenosyltransferase [Aeoliella sp.]